jgi:hypothetical protein
MLQTETSVSALAIPGRMIKLLNTNTQSNRVEVFFHFIVNPPFGFVVF